MTAFGYFHPEDFCGSCRSFDLARDSRPWHRPGGKTPLYPRYFYGTYDLKNGSKTRSNLPEEKIGTGFSKNETPSAEETQAIRKASMG